MKKGDRRTEADYSGGSKQQGLYSERRGNELQTPHNAGVVTKKGDPQAT